MQREVINKITITAEAVFDYKDCLCLPAFDRRQLKAEVEEYIDNLNKAGRLWREHYFRCKYLDEQSGQMLMLFLYRGEKISVMQYWNLAGICLADDWCEEAEEKGWIRNWLKMKIQDLPEEADEVVALRVREVIQSTAKTKFENVLTEVLNEFEYDRDKEVAKELAFLQSIHFEHRERERPRNKTRKSRKGGKHAG